MSKIDTDTMPALASPLERDLGAFDLTVASNRDAAIDESPYGGRAVIKQEARITTAQRVAVPRDDARIMRRLGILCATFGDKFVYSWEVNDNANRRKQVIEGGTIQLANAIVSIYGNCAVECDIEDGKDHWIFKAYFMDYESGFTVSRLFQQRKKATMGGRYDQDRALDMQFQIGQSKAIRNVVLNALGWLRDYGVEQSKQAVVRKFNDADNKAKAWAFIERVIEANGIDIKQIEAVRGRRAGNFTVPDLARTYTEIMAIHDGMADPADIYPALEEAGATETGDDENADKTRQPRKPRATKQKEEKGDAGNSSGSSGGDGPGGAGGGNGDVAGTSEKQDGQDAGGRSSDSEVGAGGNAEGGGAEGDRGKPAPESDEVPGNSGGEAEKPADDNAPGDFFTE